MSQMLCLKGRPGLKSYLRFVGSKSVQHEPESDLVEEWQAAEALLRILEKDEAGIADHPKLEELGPEYDPILVEFLKDPIQQASFNTVPTGISLIELDRLVVFQRHVDVTYADGLVSELGPDPDRDRIFRMCLPFDHPRPPVKFLRVDSGTYVFTSPSNDLRFLGSHLFKEGPIRECAPWGDVVGCLGLAVGFSSNLMNAFLVEGRLVLYNGTHRAYALRKAGITHVPCIVQHVPSRATLEAVAPAELVEKADHYLQHPRPPMLRDYLDPRLHKTFEFRRRLQQVTIKFETSESELPT